MRKTIKSLLFGALFCTIVSTGTAQNAGIEHCLKGKIIRSLTAKDQRMLAGIKGDSAGTGLVWLSENSGKTWTATNDGAALAPEVEDVQTVAIVSEKVFLAGTWKNGLYRSKDAGLTWQRLEDFPSKDIRSISVCEKRPKTIYAATTTHGVLKSTNGGKKWKANSQSDIEKNFKAAWAVRAMPHDKKMAFAMAFGQGVWRTVNGGKSWEQVLQPKGMASFDLDFVYTERDTSLWAVSSNDSVGVLHRSFDLGKTWERVKGTPDGVFCTVKVYVHDHKVPAGFVGTWDKGLFQTARGKWQEEDQVAHSTISAIVKNKYLIAFGTWGDGIFMHQLTD